MRWVISLFALGLAGCAPPNRISSLCDIPDLRSAIGSEVQFKAMLISGNSEHPPLVTDERCWHSLGADTKDAPLALLKAFESPGLFNKFAVVSGRIQAVNNEPWLHITAADQISVRRPMTVTEEQRIFSRMVREGNAWNAAHPR